MADHKIDSIADIHRGFNKMFGINIKYKPFHNQLVKDCYLPLLHHRLQ